MFLLVPSYPGSPGQKAVKPIVCVCVCVCVCVLVYSVKLFCKFFRDVLDQCHD